MGRTDLAGSSRFSLRLFSTRMTVYRIHVMRRMTDMDAKSALVYDVMVIVFSSYDI